MVSFKLDAMNVKGMFSFRLSSIISILCVLLTIINKTTTHAHVHRTGVNCVHKIHTQTLTLRDTHRHARPKHVRTTVLRRRESHGNWWIVLNACAGGTLPHEHMNI